MCKFITIVFISFGWCSMTLLSHSLYSMENSELSSSSWQSLSLHYLIIRYGEWTPWAQNLVHFKHSWAPLLRAQSPSHILTAPAFHSDVQARRWEQLGGLYLESSLFFGCWRWRHFLCGSMKTGSGSGSLRARLLTFFAWEWAMCRMWRDSTGEGTSLGSSGVPYLGWHEWRVQPSLVSWPWAHVFFAKALTI